jgi:AraC family transcriptional regulator
MMKPEIKILPEKKLAGQRMIMSFSENKTYELWRKFMPDRHSIINQVDASLYSIEVYPPDYFDQFDPSSPFEKWAAVEVSDFRNIPAHMETLTLPRGMYAVFMHRGPASTGPDTYGYIFRSWLPRSEYQLDQRPHFAWMGEKYKKDDPDSEEEIWIPVKH